MSRIYTVNDSSFEMMEVEGGSFIIGEAAETDGTEEEVPAAHPVTLSNYFIGRTTVTQALWKAVMGMDSTPSQFKGDNSPVENVSWEECQAFITRLNSLTGLCFRLPTEAEWEFAARGGNSSRHTRYSGSDNIDDVAWHKGNSGHKTHPVATKQPNELGIYDMSGNVWEWCSDWQGCYDSNVQTDPTGPASGCRKTDRGGSWCSVAELCSCTARNSAGPDRRYFNLGFRLCLPDSR